MKDLAFKASAGAEGIQDVLPLILELKSRFNDCEHMRAATSLLSVRFPRLRSSSVLREAEGIRYSIRAWVLAWQKCESACVAGTLTRELAQMIAVAMLSPTGDQRGCDGTGAVRRIALEYGLLTQLQRRPEAS